MIRQSAVAAFLAIAAHSGAVAQDWNGAYTGVSAGVTDLRTEFQSNGELFPTGSYSENGASLGAQAGYGWLAGPIYFGLEADIRYLNGVEALDARMQQFVSGGLGGSGTGSCVGACEPGGGSGCEVIGGCVGGGGSTGPGRVPTASATETVELEGYSSRLDAAASFRARLGLPIGRFMPYATAGIVGGLAKLRYVNVMATRPVGSGAPATVTGVAYDDWSLVGGYTLGAGMEFAATDRISLRGDYSFADFGRTSIEFDGSPVEARISNKLHEFRIGVNYRF